MPFTALPADRPRAEAGAAAAYRAAGLPEPAHVVWASSPLAGAALTALLDPELSDETRAQIVSLIPAGACTLRSGAGPERALSSAEAAELLPRLGAGAPVRERVRSQPWEAERAAAYAELGPVGWAEAWGRTAAPSWEPVNALAARIRAAIGDAGRATEDDEEDEELSRLLRGATLDAVLGQHDAPWLALFAALGRSEPLRGLAEVAESAGWWWPREDLLILTERPSRLCRDEPGRLHSGDGPALAYPDGFGLHAWRGMPFPAEFVGTLARLTPELIRAEENAELRRIMLEHFGYDRYLAESGATPRHKDETGVLWRIELPDDEPVVMVEVLNSTPEPDGTIRTYYLRVPPDTRTAREGVAWTFGLEAADYRPEKET
ncbi:DUF6745 domain-containing protein [Actinocorallia sp. A-T 12471]|uniref:DUF6745 domain-containing protein n=1 Tax=Actinocorallia sp. A-T 12471 TaxID=3089813 RepID=UPI0029D38286|nr:hypothetical protein [Actinocorallia sp. A-T 12471]MDX6739860.1 hypothetical protein [Actinocorallia sp. A-T 12471]